MELHLPRGACLEILTHPLGVLKEKTEEASERKIQRSLIASCRDAYSTFIILLLLVLDLKVVRLQRLLRAAFQSCGFVYAQSHVRFSPQVWLAAVAGVNPPKLLEVIEIRPSCFGGAFLGDASCGNRPGSWALAASNNETVAALLCCEASGSFYLSILSFWVGRCW